MPINVTYRNSMLDDLPNTQYLALYVGDPLGAGTEITGTGYARISVTMGAASAGQRANTTTAQFDTSTATDWPSNVDYSAMMSASSGGSVISADALGATRDMSGSSTTMDFGVGDITQSAS